MSRIPFAAKAVGWSQAKDQAKSFNPAALPRTVGVQSIYSTTLSSASSVPTGSACAAKQKGRPTKGQQLCMSTLIRGHFLPLRLTIPPLRTPQGFACSVASLSRCPCHYPPGYHDLRHATHVECPLGQGKPSTWPEGHDESTYTSLTSFHLDDRRARPLPAGT